MQPFNKPARKHMQRLRQDSCSARKTTDARILRCIVSQLGRSQTLFRPAGPCMSSCDPQSDCQRVPPEFVEPQEAHRTLAFPSIRQALKRSGNLEV